MAKVDVGTEVIMLVVLGASLITVYTVYETSRITRETGAAIQKPFAWFGEGLEFWADTLVFWDGKKDRASQGGADNRTFLGKDPNSWGWGYGPKKGFITDKLPW